MTRFRRQHLAAGEAREDSAEEEDNGSDDGDGDDAQAQKHEPTSRQVRQAAACRQHSSLPYAPIRAAAAERWAPWMRAVIATCSLLIPLLPCVVPCMCTCCRILHPPCTGGLESCGAAGSGRRGVRGDLRPHGGRGVLLLQGTC